MDTKGQGVNKKLVQHGDSKAIILDKRILKLLKIDDKTIFEIKIEGGSIVLTPKGETNSKRKKISKDKKIQKAYDKISKKYKEAFKKLAE